MKICTRCVLPETFPGIAFDEEGCCSYCIRYSGRDNQEKLKERFKQKFFTILEKTKNRRPYDAVVAYSGGKDSTYTLRLLKDTFGLRVLAITFDHGFVSPMALENIRNVTENLNINLLTIQPGAKTLRSIFVKSMAKDIYPIKALERASSICNSCMNLVKSFLLRSAIDMGVSIIAYGWSPGQAPIQSSVLKTNPSMSRQTQMVIVRVFEGMSKDDLRAFFLEERHFARNSSQSYVFPYIVHPLAFMDYNQEQILSSIMELGWVNPTDTDANSTNCLLNGFANEVHIKKYKFHPYAFEIAALVREGYMTREEGIKKLSTPPDPRVIDYVKRKLGLSDQ